MKSHKYYSIAKNASEGLTSNPGLLKILKLAKSANKILDVGCGEGTKLSLIAQKNKGYGIDINKYAVSRARKQYPHLSFSVYDGNKAPFKDNSFDLVFSAFVLEHTQNPEKFINEMIRVVKHKGKVAIICPNFGSPNRRSPVSKENSIAKLLKGFLKDIFFQFSPSLSFTKVTPKKTYINIDDDTTCEPYLFSTEKYLKNNPGIVIMEKSSLWSLDNNLSMHQGLFKRLGQAKIFPFSYWGPQLFIVFQKK